MKFDQKNHETRTDSNLTQLLIINLKTSKFYCELFFSFTPLIPPIKHD